MGDGERDWMPPSDTRPMLDELDEGRLWGEDEFNCRRSASSWLSSIPATFELVGVFVTSCAPTDDATPVGARDL